MVAPTLKVEIAFLQSNSSYVWSDVSSYVRTVEIDRGVSRETDKYSAGQATVVLSNKLRYFDPTFADVDSTRTNYILNPSFESATTGWGLRNGTVAVSPLDAYSGSSCGLFTVGSAGTSAGINVSATTTYMPPVVPFNTYAFTMYVKDVNTSKQYRAFADWYDSSGVYLGSGMSGTATTVNASTWTQVSVTGLAPVNAAYARPYVYSATGFLAGDAGKQVKFDGALFEASGSLNSYFDGSTIAAGLSCSWNGTANLSTSSATVYVSPFYGQVTPAGAIRITSGGYVIFYGSIDNWNFDFPENGFDGIATVNAFDSLSELAKRSFLDNFPAIQTTGQRITWALDRPEVMWNSALQDIDNGVNTVQDLAVYEGTNVLSYIQQVADAEVGDVFCSRDGKITFRDRRFLDYSWNTPTYRYNLCTCPSFESGKNSYWIYGSANSAKSYYGSKSLISTYVAGDGTCYVAYDEYNVAKWTAQGTGSYTVSLYVWSPVTTLNMTVFTELAGVTVNTTTAAKTVTASAWTRISLTLTATGAFDEFNFIIDNGLSSTLYYVDGVLIEKSSTMDAYFDGTIVPDAGVSIRYTSSWDSTVNLSTSTLARQSLKSTPTPVTLNLSDYSGSDIPVTQIVTVYASENLFNRVVLTADASVPQIAEDTTLQSIYGIRTFSMDALLNESDTAVLANANEFLTTYSRPEFRASEVQLELHSLSGANQSSVLSSELRDAVKLTFKPSRTGSQMIKNYVIIGMTHSIHDAEHTMTFRIASLQNTPFRLNSTTTGVLDANVLGYD